MSEPQAVAVKFEGEELATATDEVSTNTRCRTRDGLYRVHIDEGDEAWRWARGVAGAQAFPGAGWRPPGVGNQGGPGYP